MMIKKLSDDVCGSAVPLIYFVLTLLVIGALFSLFFIDVFFPLVDMVGISDSVHKSFILLVLRGICLFIFAVGCVALLISAVKERWMMGGVR